MQFTQNADNREESEENV